MNSIDVVAAIIIKDNKYFIAQRNKKTFRITLGIPRGKVEENESEDALKKENKEELNIDISIKNKLAEENYSDEKVNIKLHYYYCEYLKGVIKLIEHENSAWVNKEDLKKYNFAEGDKDIISLL